MNATAMKNAIVAKMNKEAGSAAAAVKKHGDAILEYIIASMDITYSWAATHTSSGSPDPTTSFVASLSGAGTLPVPASFSDMLIKLAAFIKSNITISPAAGFSLSPLSFNPTGVLTVTMNRETTQDSAMLNYCTQIISCLISSFPDPAAKSGSHGSFSGATMGMGIA